MRPGVRGGDLYAKAIDTLAPLPLHQALGASVGHGIGLSLNEQPELVAGAEAELVQDGVYTLEVGIADAKAGNVLLSAMVRNAPVAAEAEVLARSPSPTDRPLIQP
jgi:Xaa-Pro aminopeptidase